ncbi:hypothetical protein MKZ38_009169 [Zalerion maritima]|uniref:Uncharacterized protein n=1 Tax=Zalerion maritima TaxID=339359 RepID=A0AAD5WUU2_9PEZI|nr:hypothetical protein MKZ38_009169 [Zalerion maritima]
MGGQMTEIEQAAAYMVSTLTFEEKSLANDILYFSLFNVDTRTAWVRAPVVDLSECLRKLVDTAAESNQVPRRINVYCDTLVVGAGTTVDINNDSGVILSIYCRKIVSEPRSDGVVLSMTMILNSQLALYANTLPPGFAAEFILEGGHPSYVPLAIDPSRFGVVVRHAGSGLQVTQRGPPRAEMQYIDYLDILNDDGTLSATEWRNDNFPRLLQFQFLVGASLIRLNTRLCLDLLNYVCASTATTFSSAFNYQANALRTSILSQLERSLCNVPSVNVYLSKEILSARLVAALAFEDAFHDYISQQRTSDNAAVMSTTLLLKGQDALDEYKFLESLSLKAYRAAEKANEESQTRFLASKQSLEVATKAFEEGIETWQAKEKAKAAASVIFGVIAVVAAVAATVATAGAAAPAAGPAAAGATASAAASAAQVVGTFAKIKEVFQKMKEVYKKLEPILKKLKEVAETIQKVVVTLKKMDSINDAQEELIQGDMSTDTFNATAEWNVFDVNVNILRENLDKINIKGKDDFHRALKTVVITGKTYLQTQQNLVKMGNELAIVILKKQNEGKAQHRLKMAMEVIGMDGTVVAVLKRAMFDRLLAVRSFVFLDFWNYTSAYLFYSLADDPPISLSAVKPISDYLSDAARLQAAVSSFASTVIVQRKRFIITTLGNAASLEELRVQLSSTGNVGFDLNAEHPAFAHYCRVRMSKVRCYLEGVTPLSAARAAGSSLALVLKTSGEFQDLDFPRYPTRTSLLRSFVGETRKILFETDASSGEILCDGDLGQERDYTLHTPFTDWMVSISGAGLGVKELDFSKVQGLRFEFWCESQLASLPQALSTHRAFLSTFGMSSIKFPGFPQVRGLKSASVEKPFEINPRNFVDLKQYLELGSSLPSSSQAFRSRYDLDLLNEFFRPDDTLYKACLEMQVLATQRSCASFSAVHSEKMSEFVRLWMAFVDEATSAIREMRAGLDIAARSNLKGEEAVQAVAMVSPAITEAANQSEALENHCRDLLEHLFELDANIQADSAQISALFKRLPSLDARKAEMKMNIENLKSEMDSLESLSRAEERRLRERINLEAVARRSPFNFLGPISPANIANAIIDGVTGTNLRDLQLRVGQAQTQWREKRRQMEEDMNTFADTFGSYLDQPDTLRRMKVLTHACAACVADISNLRSSIFSQRQNIAGAKKSVQDVGSATSRRQTGFHDLEMEFKDIIDQLSLGEGIEDVEDAKYELEEAEKTYGEISNLAQTFQQVVSLSRSGLAKVFTVAAANYGGADVESVAEGLVKDERLEIDTNHLSSYGFPDPKTGHRKTIAILYQAPEASTAGVFVAVEGSGAWVLSRATIRMSGAPPRPVGSSLWIVAVVYGKEEITDAGAFSRLYHFAKTRKAFEVSNSTFGKDTWFGVPKTCAIFYQMDNWPIRCLGGWERDYVKFDI